MHSGQSLARVVVAERVIASLDASSEEAQALREALYQLRRKQKIITIEGVEYRLRVRIHQSFGEDVFRVTIKKGRKAKP